MTTVRVLPEDEHNAELVANVHPPDWRNPEPASRYNLVVIGAGSAGLSAAGIAAGLGAKVALVERHLMGGDCLITGCVPSKAVIRSARLAAEARRAGDELGFGPPAGALPDFGAAMARMRRLRARISPVDSARRFRDEFGVDVFLGEARFVAPDAVEVDGARLCFARAVIATGGRAFVPPVPGLAEAEPLTNETLWSLTERPRHLAVIGGGPIGCEMAQTFRRLGSAVTVMEMGERLLPRDDPDASAIVRRVFEREGIALHLGARVVRVERKDDERVLHVEEADGAVRSVGADAVLVAAGRAPNVEGLGLEAAGVAFDPRQGVVVDDFLRTTNRRIYAAGDVCMRWKFTHAANAAAKIVVRNALFFGRGRASRLVMPWCTYTDPEVAHVGAAPGMPDAPPLDTVTISLEHNDRAITEGDDEGFVRVHLRRGSDRVLGATVVAAHAGEMLPQMTLAIERGIGLRRFLGLVYPYPTESEAFQRAAGEWARGRLTPRLRRVLEAWMRWRR